MRADILIAGAALAGLAVASPATAQTPGAWGAAEQWACNAAEKALPPWPKPPLAARERNEQSLRRMLAALPLHQAGGICSGWEGAADLVTAYTQGIADTRRYLATAAQSSSLRIAGARQFSLSCVGRLRGGSNEDSIEEDFDVDLDQDEVNVDGAGTTGTYTRKGTKENYKGIITTYNIYDLSNARIYLGFTMTNNSANYYHTTTIDLMSGRYEQIISREGSYARNRDVYVGSCTRKTDEN